jgi:hypothetical protein
MEGPMGDEEYKKSYMEYAKKRFPAVAIETVRERGKPRKYNAEIVWQGHHYVISKGHSTREEAKKIAEELCQPLCEALVKLGDIVLKKYPIAKE